MSDLLNSALSYARRGWYVFPCREKPGNPYEKNGETIIPKEKTPYVGGGLDSATIDEDKIRAWWTQFPNAMIGVNCGKSGLFVVDIDKKHVNGLETFMSWNINDEGALHSWTPSGGMHIVYIGLGKSSTNATTGIDTRGTGGYFIAPPSRIIEGDNVGGYNKIDDWGRNPIVIPNELMEKLFPEKSKEYNYSPSVSSTIEGKRQLSRTTFNFITNGAPAGSRNHTLFKAVVDFVGCGYSEQETREILLPVSRRIGLDNGEFETVLSHGFSKPRTPSIPDSIQEKILKGSKTVASEITKEEQSIMEDALLACLIKDNDLVKVIADILNDSDFQVIKNRIIYKIILRLYSNNVKVDLITVMNEVNKMTDKIKLDEISNLLQEHYLSSESVIQFYELMIFP